MRGVITLCGSTKFYKLFDEICYQLTKADFAVFTIGTMLNSDKKLEQSERILARFDRLHKSKIDISDAIFVIDKDGYIGKSTQSEIDYAMEKEKRVFYYSKDGLKELQCELFCCADILQQEGSNHK